MNSVSLTSGKFRSSRQLGSREYTDVRSGKMTTRLGTLLLALFLIPMPLPAAQNSASTYMGDNSDWWSHARTFEFDQKIPIQKLEPSASNFQILGLDLGFDMFDKAAAKLGKATIIERGDAATGRFQVCYRSVEDSGGIRLILERGEVADTFYLLAGGPDWKGSDSCVKSSLVAKNLSTDSGLRLGLTPSEVKAILGAPSTKAPNKLIFSYGVKKKSSAEDFDRLRQQHPELNETDLHRNYEFYSLGVDIEARFSSSRLAYLAVSKTEAY